MILLSVLFLLLSACANHHEPVTLEQPPVSAQHSAATTSQPNETPTASDSVAEKVFSGKEESKQTASIQASSKVQDTQKSAMKEPEISLDELVERLKKTEAIGVFTKLAIRSDVLDFKESIDTYRKKGVLEKYIGHLRDHFDGLLLKILTLLERDPPLSRDIQHARESIWRSFLEAKL